MGYIYETDKDSRNFTPASRAVATFGMPRVIEGITIHWWGDPNQNPRFDNIVNFLLANASNTSAHYVATGDDGTGKRRVACIVSPYDIAHHAGSAWGNARTIGIELDPRARDVDYDVAAELIADIRSAFGDVPIYWHSYFIQTACPGRWDAERLDKLSYTKFSHATEWGKGGNIVTQPTPTPSPAPAPVPAPSPVVTPPPVTQTAKHTYEVPKSFKVKTETTLVNIPDNTGYTKELYAVGRVIDEVVEKIEYSNGTAFYRTKYARDTAKRLYGFNADHLVEVVPVTPDPVVVVPSPTTQQPDGEPLPDTGKPITEKDGYTEADRARDNAMKATVDAILKLLKSIWGSLTSLHKKVK